MDERDLDKKLRSKIKPGTESLALNESQISANQLLTEQRMNLESERSMMSSSESRDTELIGAVELGINNQSSGYQDLPPQASGLRPETQELLSKYGVNPTISERSRSNSNTTSSRTTNSSRRNIPNKVTGGETKINNTTNVTNITNNNTDIDTDIDASNPSSGRSQYVPISGSSDNTGKFKAFLNNIMSKREQERQIQDREFRRRDWSIQRMTKKVLNRMNSISDDFSKKMNPENIGRTFTSQIKMILTMAGFLLLPKVFPSLIKGIDSLSGFVNDGVGYLKGVFGDNKSSFTDKLSEVFTNGISKLTGKINESLGKLIGGSDYKDGQGLSDVIGEKISSALGGRDSNGNIQPLGDRLKSLFSELKGQISEVLSVMAEDRAEAVKSAASKINASDLINPKKLLPNLINVIGAAVGGHSYLETASMNSSKSDAADKLKSGSKSGEFTFFGDIKSNEGVKRVTSNISKAAVDSDENNSVTIAEGLKELYKYGTKKDSTGITIRADELNNIMNRISQGDDDKKRLLSEINKALKIGAIKTVRDEFYTRTGIATYEIPKNSVPTFIALMNGLPVTFDKNKIDENNMMIKKLYDNKDLYKSHLEYLDSITTSKMKGSYDPWAIAGNALKGAYNGLTWFNRNYAPDALKTILPTGGLEYSRIYDSPENKSSLMMNDYYKNKKAADEYKSRLDASMKNLGKGTEVSKVNIPLPSLPSLDNLDKSVKSAYSSYVKPSVNYVSDKTDYILTKMEMDPNKVGMSSPKSGGSSTKQIKNNNPGNIRGAGSKGFTSFSTLSDGYSAMFNKITKWFEKTPSTLRSSQLNISGKPSDTINKFIRVWAPAQDNNDEENYVSFLEKYTGHGRNQVMDINDKNFMTRLAEGMTIMEHGVKPNEVIRDSISNGWDNRRFISSYKPDNSSTSPILTDVTPNESSDDSLSSMWSSMISGLDQVFGSDDIKESNPLPSEISKYTSNGSMLSDATSVYSHGRTDESNWSPEYKKIIPSSIPEYSKDIPEEVVDEPTELDDGLSSGIINLNSGGNTSVANSGNTTVINYNINDPKNSFIDIKSRDYRRG